MRLIAANNTRSIISKIIKAFHAGIGFRSLNINKIYVGMEKNHTYMSRTLISLETGTDHSEIDFPIPVYVYESRVVAHVPVGMSIALHVGYRSMLGSVSA